MAHVRVFRNTPMLDTESDAVDYFATMPVLSCAGHVGPDGSRRFLVEVAIDCATDEVADEAGRIERAAR